MQQGRGTTPVANRSEHQAMTDKPKNHRNSIHYPHPSSAAVSAVMKGNRKRDTTPEMLIRRLLHSQGLRYRVNHRLLLGDVAVRPDIVFVRRRLAVFVDGCFWHSCPEHGTQPRANPTYWGPKLARNQARDQLVNERLTLSGWTVLRVWEHEPPATAVERIVEALMNSRDPKAE
jgi:DNA mismatch endonuclease, patch repair protein